MKPARDTPSRRGRRVAGERRPATAGLRQLLSRLLHAYRLVVAPRAQLPLLLTCAALGALLVWQVRPPFQLDAGSPNDDPYLINWHASELTSDATFTYRWSRDRSEILIPAFGATRATLTVRLRGAPNPEAAPPAATIDFGAGPRQVALASEPRDYTFDVPASAFNDGGLRVTIESPTFRPPGDNRDLGVLLDRVNLRDAGAPAGLILPPARLLLTVLLLAALAYGVFALAFRRPGPAAIAGWATIAAVLIFGVRSRFELGLFAPALAGVSVGTAAGFTAALYLARWLRRRYRWSSTESAVSAVVLIASLQFLVLMLGMRHPQFRSSDLMLNVHRLEFVQQGKWVFSLALPGPRAILAPYPPAFYAVMLPFSAWIDASLLVELTASLMTVVGVPLTFVLARRLTGSDTASLWAAGAFTLAPVTYEMASSGNFANLYAQGVANLYLVALVLTVTRWTRPLVVASLTGLLAVALLGHFGVFLSLLALGPLLLLAVWLGSPPGARERRAVALGGSYAVALTLAWVLYYRFQAPLFCDYLRLVRGSGAASAPDSTPSIPVARRLLFEWRGALASWGGVGIATGLLGSPLLARLGRSTTRALTSAWLGSALLFAGIAVVVGLSVRYGLFVLPPFAAAAGLVLTRVSRARRIAGPLLASLLTILWFWQTCAFWVARVLHEYH